MQNVNIIFSVLCASALLQACDLTIRGTRAPTELTSPSATPSATPASTPSVAITLPAASSYANIANVTTFAVSGTCSEDGRVVTLSGSVSATPTCTLGSWNHTFDLTALGQGAFTINADHSNAAGTNATTDSRGFIKDTVAPGLAALTVANGTPTDTNPFYLVYGTITDTYTQYCILQNDTTIGNCSFTTSTLPATYTVTEVNESKTLSVWLRDAAGNTSTRTDTAAISYTGVLAISPTSATITATRGQTTLLGGRLEMGSIETAGGDIFVAGGRRNTTAVADALFIRNTTHLWEGVARMHTARIDPPMVELSNGKILVVGGCTSTADLGTSLVEIFDPATGRWAKVASMSAARCRHTVTLLSDGRILVAGGRDGASFHSTTEIYSVNTNRWIAGPALTSQRHFHRAFRVANSKVVLLGGGSNTVTALNTVDIFDPSNDSIAAGATMNTARMDFGAIYHTAVEDGNFESIHVIGGWDGAATINATEIYDINNGATGAWISRAALTSARRGKQYTKLASGGALAVAGWGGGGVYYNSVERYSRTLNTWTNRTNNSNTQHTGVAAKLGDGYVILMGGLDATYPNGSPRVREFNDGTNTWTWGHDLLRSMINMTSAKLNDGSVISCGGIDQNDGNSEQNECYRYYPSKHSLSAIGKLRSSKAAARIVTLSNGIAAVIGGMSNGGSERHNELDLYDPTNNSWSVGTNLPRFLANYTATALPGSKFLIAGGFGGMAFNTSDYLDESWVYDYGTNAYTQVGNMPGNRSRTCYAMTPSGRFFVMGGFEFTTVDTWYNTLFEYSVGAQTWSSKTSTNETLGREWCSLVAYESGGNEYLIVTGGSRDLFVTNLNSVERYDVTNNTWTTLTNMTNSATIHFSHINVAANRLWVFGGWGGVQNSVQEYNMLANTWSAATNMAADRYNTFMSSISLDDGRVLVLHGSGDYNRPGEVYHFAAPQAYQAAGGDKNYQFTVTGGGSGTMHSESRTYVPPFPLPGGTSNVRVTDGLGATANSTVTH